jgi:hypothetical protein
MAQYGFLVNSDTGISVAGPGFKESEFPSSIPSNTMLVKFDESTANFDTLHGMFFGDPNRLTVNIKPSYEGGIVYNKSNSHFTFNEYNWSIDEDQLRNVRNNFLSATDKYLIIPDLPQSLKDELIAYRNELRNITDKFGNEWKTVHDVEWPPIPSFIQTEMPDRIEV